MVLTPFHKKALLFAALVTAGAVIIMKSDISSAFLPSRLRQSIKNELGVSNLSPSIRAPQPLVVQRAPAQSYLTHDGVIEWTNTHREAEGLPPLVTNDLLAQAAAEKLNDMFAQQYFEHESPDGTTIGDLISATGYAYIAVGENLAKGNFADDEDLVQAWMDSPGHRENIMDTRYTQIGIAVAQGEFDGQTVWLAVQEFGLPATACPNVDARLKASIDEDKARYDELEAELTQREQELDGYKNDRDTYNAKVREYNEMVGELNTLVERVKATIARYNAQVDEVNACIKAYER